MSTLYCLLAVLSAAFFQCNKSDEPSGGGNLPFEVSITEWKDIPATGGNKEFELQTPAAWTSKVEYKAGGENWLSVSKASGAAGKVTIQLSMGNNMSYDTKREANLIIKCGTESKSIVVSQNNRQDIIPEKSLYEVNAGDTLLSVSVSSNVSYTCQIVQEGKWISQVQNKSGMENSTVKFRIDANPTQQERTAVVQFVGEGINPVEVSIVQHGTSTGKQFTLFQLNLWEECGHNSTDGYSAFQSLVDQIVALQPDFATFCELYKTGSDAVIDKLVAALKAKGLTYYGKTGFGIGSGGARGLLSKYPIDEVVLINAWMFKGVCNVDGKRVAVYPSHSNYVYYSCYYPRGYNDGGGDGGWGKLAAPITDVGVILDRNAKSGRPESAQQFINDAKKELDKGAIVILAGDLNEPSHLDWQADTKDMFEHNGCVVNWQTSLLLSGNGYIDAYREKYPDPVKYPGLTWPANNEGIPVSSLVWAGEADERDRIDFVYYYPDQRISLVDIKMVGPAGTIVKSQRVPANTADPIIESANGHWPSDHKGLLATFRWEK